MHSRKHAIPDISAQVLTAETDNLCSSGSILIRKQTNNRLRYKLHQDSYDKTKACCNINSIPEGLSGTFRFTGPDILGTERRYRRQH